MKSASNTLLAMSEEEERKDKKRGGKWKELEAGNTGGTKGTRHGKRGKVEKERQCKKVNNLAMIRIKSGMSVLVCT